MSRQAFTSPDGAQFAPASHTAVASTASETNLWNPALWTFVNAGDPQPGKAYILRAGGIISTTGTPTITFTPRWGQSATPASNVTLGASIALTTGSALSNVPWYAEFLLGFRQLGIAASGSTATGNGYVMIGGPTATASQVVTIGATVPTNLDHTTAQGLIISATWGTSSASNTITAQWTLLVSAN